MMQLKPLLKMNSGEFDLERVRTRKMALARVIELLNELGPLEDLALVHPHAPEEAQALGHKARHLAPKGTYSLTAEVAPVTGTYIGPVSVGFVAIKTLERRGLSADEARQ